MLEFSNLHSLSTRDPLFHKNCASPSRLQAACPTILILGDSSRIASPVTGTFHDQYMFVDRVVWADVAYKVILQHSSCAQRRDVGEIRGVQPGGAS